MEAERSEGILTYLMSSTKSLFLFSDSSAQQLVSFSSFHKEDHAPLFPWSSLQFLTLVQPDCVQIPTSCID